MEEEKKIVNQSSSEIVKRQIIQNFIQPNFLYDVQNMYNWVYKWKSISSSLFITSDILVISSSLISYCGSSLYDIQSPAKELLFVGASISMFVVFLNRFATFAHGKSKKKQREINALKRLIKSDQDIVLTIRENSLVDEHLQ